MIEEKTSSDEKTTQPSKIKLPRLYHKKSRTGCQRCRARRVKCDETKPVCGSCNRHEVPCVYVNPAPVSKPTIQKSTTSSLNSPEKQNIEILEHIIPFPLLQYDQEEALQQAIYPSESRSGHDTTILNLPECKTRRKLELRLLQNFIENTSNTFSACNTLAVCRAWSVDVPKLSLNHDNLLYEMFAISTLHLLKSEPKNSELIIARQTYLGLTLREHRRAVAQLHSQSVDEVCFTSSFISIDSFASIQDRPLDPYLPPIDCLQMARGAGSIFAIALNAINNFETSSVQTIVKVEPDLCDHDALFSSRNRDSILEDILNHEKQSELWDLETSQAYERSLSFIGSIKLAMENGEHILCLTRRIMAFTPLIPKKFVELVGECRPRALVMMAHYFALAASMTDIWWIGNMAQREVEAIARVLSPQWQSVMVAPLSAVGLVPNL